METQTSGFERPLEIRKRSVALAGAVALAALGVVAAFVSAVAVDPLYAVVGAEWSDLGQLLERYIVQPGFGLVAAGYIWWRDDYNPLDRIRTPSAEGIAWIGLGSIGYEVAVRAVTPALPLIGLSHGTHPGGPAKWRAFLNQPELILPGLLVMFVVMAPMEEALYRGAVHDTLERAVGPLGRVLVGALLFGGMHLVFSGVSGVLTTILGVLLAAGYERTENLTVPILAHAGYWLLWIPL